MSNRNTKTIALPAIKFSRQVCDELYSICTTYTEMKLGMLGWARFVEIVVNKVFTYLPIVSKAMMYMRKKNMQVHVL